MVENVLDLLAEFDRLGDRARRWEVEQTKQARLQNEVWAQDADGIDAQILNERDELIARFKVDLGAWTTIIDNLHTVVTPTGEDSPAIDNK